MRCGAACGKRKRRLRADRRRCSEVGGGERDKDVVLEGGGWRTKGGERGGGQKEKRS